METQNGAEQVNYEAMMAALQSASGVPALSFSGVMPNGLPMQGDVDGGGALPLPSLDPNPYMIPQAGDFFPTLFPSGLSPHLLEQRMYSVREICAHYGLKCSADGTKEGWRFRDRTRALFLNMQEDQRRFIRNHPVHNVLVHRMPAKMLVSDFARNILILGFHFMLKDGQLPQFWRKTQFRRSALLARLRPEDMVPQNNIAVAEVAHYLWAQHHLPFKVAMDEALSRAERNQQLSMMELSVNSPMGFTSSGLPPDFDVGRFTGDKDLLSGMPSLLQTMPPILMPGRDVPGSLNDSSSWLLPDLAGGSSASAATMMASIPGMTSAFGGLPPSVSALPGFNLFAQQQSNNFLALQAALANGSSPLLTYLPVLPPSADSSEPAMATPNPADTDALAPPIPDAAAFAQLMAMQNSMLDATASQQLTQSASFLTPFPVAEAPSNLPDHSAVDDGLPTTPHLTQLTPHSPNATSSATDENAGSFKAEEMLTH
eukprot:GGOE01018468.1.p1 GENE.GGOE01018468.1~~GGOE01018468.1.p1  ORF type:complete len:541 (+),score=92.88 GGOE01018468.1:168-1625(+)